MEKKAFKRISSALLVVGVFWVLTSYMPRFLWDFSFDNVIESELISSLLSFISSIVMYTVATLIIYLFLRKLPTLKEEPKKKMKLSEFLGWACSMRGVAMVLSLVGVLLFIILVLAIRGPSSIMELLTKSNPLLQLDSFDMVMNLVLISVVAPIMEEIMFRRLFLDALRPFGDLVAILYSGLAFGLLHMNVQQITYACGLGIMLGYVMTKTNNLLCCIGLHATLNASTAVLLPLLENVSDLDNIAKLLPIGCAIGLLIVVSIIGLVLFFMHLKHIRIEKPRFRFIAPINAKLVILNIGTIPYILLCLAVSIVVIIKL